MGRQKKTIAQDLFILLKLLIVGTILFMREYDKGYLIMGYSIFFYFAVYLSRETLVYIPTLFFDEQFPLEQFSKVRIALLMFIHYWVLIFTFAITYLSSRSISFAGGQRVTEPFDSLYFSVITACTIGYGDTVQCFCQVLRNYPVSHLGHIWRSTYQCIVR